MISSCSSRDLSFVPLDIAPKASNETLVLSAPASNHTYVAVSALKAGQLTLPKKLFVPDADPEKRATVSSLAFLVQHGSSNLIFDLGLKRDFTGYREAQRHHIAQRRPTTIHLEQRDTWSRFQR